MKNRSNRHNRFKMRKVLSILLLSVCLVALALGIILKNGFALDSFSISRLAISEFSLIWQEKLVLEIGEIVILEQGSTDTSNLDFKKVRRGISLFRHLANLFSRVTVREIRVAGLVGTINLSDNRDKEASYFFITSSDLEIRINLIFTQDSLTIDITKASSLRFNSEATGNLKFDVEKETLSGTISANISGSLPVSMDVVIDSNQLSFEGKRSGEIKTITPFVETFGLSHNIQRWITDYLKGSSYDLQSFSGVVPWSNPGIFLDSLYAEVRVIGCEYTFAPGLEPIKTDYTDIVFSEGVLTIKPVGPTFYGQEAEGSWLDINFNDIANIVFTAHILTNAMANGDIITLLKYYKIPLPFKQVSGSTQSNLLLTINLNKLKISTRGTFSIDDGRVEYKGKEYGVEDALITLANSDVTINKITVSDGKRFVAKLSGLYQANNGTGDLEISLEQCAFTFGDSSLQLNAVEAAPKIQFHIRPDGHSLDGSASSWKMNSRQFEIGPFSTSFSFEKLSAAFPPVLLTTANGAIAKISGNFSIKEKEAKILCVLLQYDFKDLSLDTAELPIIIQYDNQLIIKLEKTSQWKLHNISTTLFPSTLGFTDNILSIKDGRIGYGNFFDSALSGHYNFHNNSGEFLLENLHLKEKKIGDILGTDNSLSVEIKGEAEELVFSVPVINLEISTDKNKNWTATITDLSSLYQRWPLLQKFKVDTGSLTVSMGSEKRSYNFSADIQYRFPLLVKDNIPVDHYIISGKITEKGFQATINDDVKVQYSEKLSASSKDISYNIPAIVDLIKNISGPDAESSREKSKITCSLEAINSSLFFKEGSQVLADKMDLNFVDGQASIRLEHNEGTIVAGLEGNTFSIEGKDLNDIFMSGLGQNADFKNGNLNFAVNGTFDHFSVLVTIKNTLLRNFKTFHNIMAFLDTVPALITFSKPEYNRKGLPVSSALIGMTVTNGVAEFETLEVISPELTMAGNGKIDFSKNVIAVYLNLITGAKASLGKIPLIGYVITDKEKKPSITLKISGDLQDPKVENSIFRKVVTWPVSVLYRTLKLPLHLLESIKGETEKDGIDKNKR